MCGASCGPCGQHGPGVDPAEVMQMADYVKMNEIRGRIDSIVTNKQRPSP